MKIVHIITTIERGGAEKQLLVLASAQVKSGHSVEVIYLKGSPELEQEFIAAKVKVKNDIANFPFLLQVLKSRLHLSKNYADIYHAHLPRAEMFAALTLGKKKFIFSRHNAEPFFPGANPRFSKWLSRFVTRKAAGGIAISDAVNLYCRSNSEIRVDCPFETIHYGMKISDRENRIPNKRTRENVPITFGTIARLVPQKDIPTLLSAMKIHKIKFPDDQLRILGDGPLKAYLQKICVDYELQSNVKWIDKTADVDAEYKRLDIFVLTSIYEGFGLVLLEAMKNELPILATNTSAIPEVVGDGNGLFFQVGDALDLAKKMEDIRKTAMRIELIKRSYIRLRDFDIEILEEKVTSTARNWICS